ncbi:hypothetical protein [Gloeothece citriformis]|nr:hypothetical protein [Gloeothece citriformis]
MERSAEQGRSLTQQLPTISTENQTLIVVYSRLSGNNKDLTI